LLQGGFVRRDSTSLAFIAFAAVAVCDHGAALAAVLFAPPTVVKQIARDTVAAIRPAPADRQPPGVKGLTRQGTGTGFFVTPQKVLTNFHVIDGCKALTVGNNSEGKEADAKLEAGDAAVDLAVLSTDEKGATPAWFETVIEMETGADLAIVGYPEHGLPVLQAELDQVSVDHADLVAANRLYPFFGAVRRGNSGSPVLDDRGSVVGVVTAKINTVAVYRRTGVVIDDVGFAISNHTVFDFLRANNIAFQTVTPTATLPPDQLLQHAHGFVRQIGCW
jgi:S1-C subfamily serine protease